MARPDRLEERRSLRPSHPSPCMGLRRRLQDCLRPSTALQRERSYEVNLGVLVQELRITEASPQVDVLYASALRTLRSDDHQDSQALSQEMEQLLTSTTVRDEAKLQSLVGALLQRIHRLDDAHTCAVCMAKPRCVVSLPCSHLVTCGECACDQCFVCGASSTSTLYVFRS